PPQLSRAGYHTGDPRGAAAARFDGREAARALTSAACLARSADRSRLCLSPIRIQRSTRVKHGEDPALLGPAWHSRDHISGTAVLEYGPAEINPRIGVQWKALRVSADPVAKPASHTRAESRGSRRSAVAAGERRTVRWREQDSNPRSPGRDRGPAHP